MTFGGLGCNLFNPALAGRAFLLISFPVQMTTWPVPNLGFSTIADAAIDGQTAATPLALIKHGEAVDMDLWDMLIGKMGGSLGEVCALALLVGFVYMLVRRIITWHIPVSILGTVAVCAALLHWANPAYATPSVHLLSGGLMLGAIFMATDYVTSPMTPKGQIIYGIAIGFLTIIIRNWGAYPEGMSFAILIMNAFTPLINNYSKPKRFGEVTK